MSDAAGGSGKRRRKEEVEVVDDDHEGFDEERSSKKSGKDDKKKRRKLSEEAEDDHAAGSSDEEEGGSDSEDEGGKGRKTKGSERDAKKAAAEAKDKKASKKKKKKDESDDDEDEEGDGSESLRAQILKHLDEASGLKKGEDGQLVRTSSLGMPSKILMKRLGARGDNKKAAEIAEIIARLFEEKRIEVFRRRGPDGTESQSFRSNTPERAKQLRGLRVEEEAVLGMIERSGGNGIWTRSMKASSKMTTQELNKILKKLENRKLIKSVHSVAFKNRRMYMAYDTEPSKDVTGGVWYNEAQLDTAFIGKIKKASVTAVSQLGGRASPRQVAARLKEKGETINPLRPEDVTQLMDSLVYEGWLDYAGAGPWRVELFARAEKAEIASKRFLIDEKVPKKKGGKGGAEISDYLDETAAGGSSGSSGSAAGMGMELDYYDSSAAAASSSSSSSSGGAGGGGRGRKGGAGGGGGAGAAGSGFLLDFGEEEDDEDESGAGAGAGAAGAAGSSSSGSGSSAGSGDPADRLYVVTRKNLTSAAPVIGDALTLVPCGSCPVQAQCVPGGLISPETCVYMSHWLQW